MKTGTDIAHHFPGLFLVHHNLPGKKKFFENKGIHHLIIALKGRFTAVIGGEDFELQAGQMIYIPADCPHHFSSPANEAGERLVAIFTDKIWQKMGKVKGGAVTLPTFPLIKELLLYLLLHPEAQNAKVYVETTIVALQEALTLRGRELGQWEHLLARVSDPRLSRAFAFLEKARTQQLSMVKLAQDCGMSSRNLNRLFLQEFALTPKQAHNQLRMKYASELLSSRKMSVTEVAYEVGFHSLSQFIHTFKKLTGKLPSDL